MARNRLRALGLSFVVALGLLALGAGSAQAANEFLLLHPVGKTFGEEKVAEATFTGTIESPAFSFTTPGVGEAYELTCLGVTVTGKVLPAVLHAKMIFENCRTYYVSKFMTHYYLLNMGKLHPCTVLEQSFEAKLKAVPVLHNKETFLLWEALEKGKPFAKVFYGGIGCPWTSVDFTGTVVSTLVQLNVAEQLVSFSPWTTLLFQEAGLPGDKLLHNGEQETFVEGSLFKLLLTGASLDKPWGAH